MKLIFDVPGRAQGDPFIFEDNGKYYLYATGTNGVDGYSANDPFGTWHYEGIVCSKEGGKHYWAPSVIKLEDTYYMYLSFTEGEDFEFMHVATAKHPLGPFTVEKRLYDRFSIDSHMIKTEAGLFLWYAEDNLEGERIGTRVFVDRFLDPFTPKHDPKEVIIPTFDEEKFTPKCINPPYWHTIEGPFWFQKDGWQYVMYSGGCYEDDTYHIGYAAAHTTEPDQKKIDYQKHTLDGAFDPVLIKNHYEEGTGHHSLLFLGDEIYAIYHGRDYAPKDPNATGYVECRTGRVCRLHVKEGIITAERYEDKL